MQHPGRLGQSGHCPTLAEVSGSQIGNGLKQTSELAGGFDLFESEVDWEATARGLIWVLFHWKAAGITSMQWTTPFEWNQFDLGFCHLSTSSQKPRVMASICPISRHINETRHGQTPQERAQLSKGGHYLSLRMIVGCDHPIPQNYVWNGEGYTESKATCSHRVSRRSYISVTLITTVTASRAPGHM